MSVNSKMTALANAIRAKANYSGKMSIDEMTEQVNGISGGSSAELVEFGTYNDTYPKADVTFYYFHPTNGYSSILVEAGNAKIWDVAKGSYMSSSIRIKTESEQGIRAVDMDENGYASLFVVEDAASFTIIGSETKKTETCEVGLLCNPNLNFYVDYVTYEDVGGMGTYYSVPRRETVVIGESSNSWILSNIVKGTVLKVVGVESCYVDDGDLVGKGSIGDVDGTCHYVAVNGNGDLLVYNNS